MQRTPSCVPAAFWRGLPERHYGLERDSIHVLPYPRGNVEVLPRGQNVWTDGTICYVGRLEARKGVAEWIDAAVAVARDTPGARFSLIGGDTSYCGTGARSMRDVICARIPDGLRERFAFVDNIPRDQVLGHLARSRMAAVPSRWENFPNTCIEAMASGLPVLVTPTGGMAEMVEDGRSGWIAEGPDPRSLETALRRALATPPIVLERMGASAAADIRTLCDNDAIFHRQVEFRRRVAERGSQRSIRIVSGSSKAASERQPTTPCVTEPPRGVAIVVNAPSGRPAAACLDGILSQTVEAASVVVLVPPGSTNIPTRADAGAWQIVTCPDGTSGAALNEALQVVGSNALAVVFVEDDWTLDAEYVSRVTDTLERCADVGIVNPWCRADGRIGATAPPAFPYQWVWNDVGPCAAFRMSAIHQAGAMRTTLAGSYALWDLSNAILAAGWRAAPFPSVLASRSGSIQPAPGPPGRTAMSYAQILSRFPDLLAGDAADVAILLQVAVQRLQASQAVAPEPAAARTDTMTPLEIVRATPAMRRQLVSRALANPAYALRWLAWHVRRAVGPAAVHHMLTEARAARGRRPS